MANGVDLVTGALGFSASHVIVELLARGRHVLATDAPAVLSDPARRTLAERLGVDLVHPHLGTAEGRGRRSE